MASVEDRWWTQAKDEATGKPLLDEDDKPVMIKTDRYGKGLRWLCRWREPDGAERKKSYRKKGDAEAHVNLVEADKLRGTYIDQRAGEVLFSTYAKSEWLANLTLDPLTLQNIEDRLRRYVEPYPLWRLQLKAAQKPAAIQNWLKSLSHVKTAKGDPLAESTKAVVFSHVSAMLNCAVDNEVISKNPCRLRSVKAPKPDSRKIVPWSRDWVMGMHAALPDRYKPFIPMGSGLGLRQGESFGLSPDDIDWLRGKVNVQRQVKIVGNRLCFALPKGGKVREVPLPPRVRDELAAYLAQFPAVEVTLPWEEPNGKPVKVKLFVTTRERTACNRNNFNTYAWRRAQEVAGIPADRMNGQHALRHFYASTLLDARESIVAVAAHLGHHNPSVTLRYYAHLMPESEDRTKGAIDAMWAPRNADGSYLVTAVGEAPCAPDVPQGSPGHPLTSPSIQNSLNSSDSMPRSSS
ncbi:integrase [Amycolatopsis lexingtonensis]|uniref:Integrase n=1 Tax=Amycolatopsis lexingtonensis TaxID=218822 RepID=A0ABR9IDT0_9PSEU|nr:site-specific integrase [Amycolatopsis lexingtonensis]MBE1501347.1 integrase [Amycolatopsis lexingtonensis]